MNENLLIGWVQSPLIDLLSDLITGKRPKGGVKDITEGVLSLGGEHISSDGRLKLEKPRYIPHEFAQSIKHALIRVNDILIVKDGATTGKTAFIFEHQLKEVAYINEHLFICRSCKEIHPLYLFYFLRSEIGNKAILSDFRGATQGGISREFAHKVIVPCAPLNEQRRIVEKLDQIFDRLRRVRDELSHIKKLIDCYRQAVLTAAFRGDLTADWREENMIILSPKNGKLIDNCLENLEDIPDGWSWKTTGQIAEITGGLTKNQNRVKLEKRVPYLRVANVYANELHLDDISEIVISETEWNKVKLKKDDLLIVEGNGSIDQVGRVALWDGSIDPCVHQNHLIKMRVGSLLLSKFELYWLLSPSGRNAIMQVASSSSGLYTLSISKISALPIPLCSIEEQHEIVRRIEERFAKIDKLEQEYQKAVKLCDRLEQETLAKAFRGELVPQDPNDEPASVLLEWIRAEQQSKTKAKTAKSKKRSSKK